MTRDAELVELFEYKVADIQAGRDPKGGRRSLAELREYLRGAALDPAMSRRVRVADRIWRQHQKNAADALSNLPALSSDESGALGTLEVGGLDLGTLNTVPEALKAQLSQLSEQAESQTRNEWTVLGRLRAALFHAELRAQAQQQTRIWLKEPRLSTIRLAYALTENLERGAPGTAVPPLHDAFSSLHRPEIAAQVLSSLAAQLSVPADELPRRYLQVRSALTQLADNPFPRTPGSDLIEARVRAAEHEQLSAEVKQALIQALKQGPDAPRSASEQPPLRSAASRLLGFLERVVPRSSGGQGLEWPLLDGLLFSRSHLLRLSEPDSQALSLAIHLPGGEETRWRGHLLRWKRVTLGKTTPHPGWEVQLSDGDGLSEDDGMNIVRLSAQRPEAESRFGGQPVRLVLVGEDLALELRPVSHADLFPLSVEARLTAALLEPGADYAHLRLARAAAQQLRGNDINPDKVSPESAARYASAPPEALLNFARQGAQTLLAYAAQGDDAVSRAFAEARTFLQLSRPHSEALLDLVRLSLHVEPLPIKDDTRSVPEVESGLYTLLIFRGEPLTVRVNDRLVALRNDYKGDLCAVMPGLTAMPVRDLLVLPMPQGAVTMIRMGERVAVGFQPLVVTPV
ncbi:hypothetical protein DKM44_04730 [Deinococcus irradiatisoli]|uniref:Uncharacterized protein n=1 Tax=Deinococcus irradiatisoli TaxID=2202254 RepID=A0A2Z3JGK2_9DEIO|nr:hypothetical protein [Deinococcus irradiatisoli]AWN22621.1 hypothetical protein DKM44_04730 [Deinococcus irradiatisoli]